MASSSSNGDAMKPHFFTIILSPPLQLHQLVSQIDHIHPPAFIEEHGRTLLDHAFLETPEGKVHKVGLTIDDEAHLWFDDGWEEFATRFSLRLGSFLVFRYEGNSRFYVLVFDTSGSEIAYPEFNPTHEDSGGEDDEIIDALERAQAFESDSPYFVVPMRRSYLKGRYRMRVPASYTKIYMTDNKSKEIRLELEGKPNRKTWRVNVISAGFCKKRKNFYWQLSTGWKSFAIENGLSPQDVCVFEQIDDGAKTYRVYIFRHGK